MIDFLNGAIEALRQLMWLLIVLALIVSLLRRV